MGNAARRIRDAEARAARGTRDAMTTKNTVLVCGFGPGISTAVAEKFGGAGYAVALVARNAERLDAGVKALAAKGIDAAAFPTDLGDPAAAEALPARVRGALGPVTVIHWNAYAGSAGDILTADAAAIHGALDIATTCLVATIRGALPDMKGKKDAAVLVTNGVFGRTDANIDAMGVQLQAMGLSLANAAKDKLVGLLSKRLAADGVYVGQVTVMGLVKGTGWDSGNATIEPRSVAEKFWALFEARREIRADAA